MNNYLKEQILTYKNEKLAAVFVAVSVMFLCGIVFFRDPHVSGRYPSCPFYYFTGLYCPGCGSLRSIYSLLHGHILLALKQNVVAIIIAIPLVLWEYIRAIALLFFNKKLSLLVFKPKIEMLIVVTIFLFAILRNLPWFPFNLLRP